MSQLLASNEDIQRWLPDNSIVTDEIAALEQVKAYRIIRSQLGNYPPTVLAGWSDPTSTPATIRQIAGKLIAAFLCNNQSLYDTAIRELDACQPR